jgi:hypothetical protein
MFPGDHAPFRTEEAPLFDLKVLDVSVTRVDVFEWFGIAFSRLGKHLVGDGVACTFRRQAEVIFQRLVPGHLHVHKK